MANYIFRAHGGLTDGHASGVRRDVVSLVKQAAEGVSWNRLGTASVGFVPTLVDGKMIPIHTKSGVQFKAGFQMYDTGGVQKWESHAKTVEYRLDLQSIDHGWANWAIQTNGKNSKTVATCLMRLEDCFSQRELVHALTRSAEDNLLCEMTK